MFVKKSWSTRKGKKYITHHIAESYWDPDIKQSRHRLLMNISKLPPHVIASIDQSLKMGKTVVVGDKVKISAGDSMRGAGLLAI